MTDERRSRGSVDLDYRSYLDLDTLLDLQKPRTQPAEHDEMLFIVIHQVFELWFKQMLHELDKIKDDFAHGRLFPALHTFKRVRMILKTVVGQLDVLETMTPLSFLAFRERLDTASGFQSSQFRELEFVLGNKRSGMLKYQAETGELRARVERRLSEPSIVDAFYDFLAHHGVPIPDDVRAKAADEPTRPSPALQHELLRLYRERPEMSILFESMMDVDEGLQEWRYRHVKIAERTIGNKRGTGGSLGVEFLKRSLFQPVFPDLWAIRHEM
jgi:tryptophan 2,3-dioxygenase